MNNIYDDDSTYQIKVSLCNKTNDNTIYESVGETEQSSSDVPSGNNISKITFNKTFFVDYYFEVNQLLSLEVFKNAIRVKTETVSLGKIIGNLNNICIMNNIFQENKKATLEASVNRKLVHAAISHLTLKFVMEEDFLELSRYELFYYIESKKNKKDYRLEYKSNKIKVQKGEEITKDLDIPTEALITMDVNEIRITFCHANEGEYLGQFCYSRVDPNQMCLKEKQEKSKVKSMNLIYKEKNKQTFKYYVMNGLDINLIIGIDYTCSNGQPNNKKSNHYLEPNGAYNDYENAILSCCQIVGNYDSDKIYPVYGFGGQLHTEKDVNHCFPINFNDADPNIKGIDNITPMYRKSFNKVTLSGPTFFAPLIERVHQQIEKEKNSRVSKYYILMILTDGLINDMEPVRNLIVQASTWPLSIIIVGIGEGDFTNMTELDGNDTFLKDGNGNVRQRDIVRFVHFNQFKNKQNPHEKNPQLANEVLKEVPSQVEEYFRLFNNSFRPERQRMIKK